MERKGLNRLMHELEGKSNHKLGKELKRLRSQLFEATPISMDEFRIAEEIGRLFKFSSFGMTYALLPLRGRPILNENMFDNYMQDTVKSFVAHTMRSLNADLEAINCGIVKLYPWILRNTVSSRSVKPELKLFSDMMDAVAKIAKRV